MANFKDREKAQEAKYANDATLRFKADARRNKMVGAWAAELLGHENPDAYASEVVAADFEEAGDEDVVRKISADFAAKSVSVSDDEIRAKLAACLNEAIAELAE